MLRLESRDQFKDRTFTAPTWPQDADKFAVIVFIFDNERNVFDCRKRIRLSVVVSLGDMIKFHHGRIGWMGWRVYVNHFSDSDRLANVRLIGLRF
jgi:hypothetical protein